MGALVAERQGWVVRRVPAGRKVGIMREKILDPIIDPIIDPRQKFSASCPLLKSIIDAF